MRRTLALLTATAALGGGAAVLAVAAPSTLNLTTRATGERATFVSTEDVFQGGKRVGTDRVFCTSVSETRASCQVTVTLAKGTIVATFTSTQRSSGGALKVVGGTGAYNGTTGSGTYRNLNREGTKTAVTLRLS